MAKTNIVLIGDICIDHNVSKGITYSSWGSPALHMAQYFDQQKAVEPTVVAAYGPDFTQYAGQFPLYPSSPRLKQTIIFENEQRGEERAQSCHYSEPDSHILLDEGYKQLLSRADIIVLCPLLAKPSFSYFSNILANSPSGSLKVLLPQGYYRYVDDHQEIIFRKHPDLDSLVGLKQFGLIILSDKDRPDPLEEARHFVNLSPGSDVVITQEARGATYMTPTGPKHVPTKPLNLNRFLDSIGCGDIFAAAAIQSYARHQNIGSAVRAGNQAAGAYLISKTIA